MKILHNVPLKDKCYYGTGGPALYYAEPLNGGELREALAWAEKNGVKFEIIGCGANTLIADSGFAGLIIRTVSMNGYILRNGLRVFAGAGVRLGELTAYAVSRGLGGFEKLSGIPGSVGGAVIMNAGAYGTEIGDRIEKIYAVDSQGREFSVSSQKAAFGYRSSPGLQGLIVTGAEFLLEQGVREKLEKERLDVLEKRKAKQPLNKPSCGSVFKRPKEGYAGAYIESCGLKGLRKGGAVISEKHANFILNDGGASASDIKYLIDKAVETVFREKGVVLEPEVRFIGFD